ncbi:MAG: prepilin-type N-terminal cleavage/methylation domain-containing protein [Planctomycetes bacterium]|nr:prepilin-type N-terminal cleavage/methylation domain-containing protein [Planctomycetota bacterium]
MTKRYVHRGFSLLEILLVTGLMAILAGLALPSLMNDIMQARLPESARQMRALIQLTRANAMIEGLRHRIRFPREDELDAQGEQRQPIVEVEDAPLARPEEFRPVLAAWARDETMLRGIRCVKVRLGKPTIDQLLGQDKFVEEADQARLDEIEAKAGESYEEEFPPLVFETDGTSEWATFLLTDAPPKIPSEDIDDDSEFSRVEVILDGLTGLAWLQRALYVEELEMMQENGWPPVLRKDFLTPRKLTEDQVLEIREARVRK